MFTSQSYETINLSELTKRFLGYHFYSRVYKPSIAQNLFIDTLQDAGLLGSFSDSLFLLSSNCHDATQIFEDGKLGIFKSSGNESCKSVILDDGIKVTSGIDDATIRDRSLDTLFIRVIVMIFNSAKVIWPLINILDKELSRNNIDPALMYSLMVNLLLLTLFFSCTSSLAHLYSLYFNKLVNQYREPLFASKSSSGLNLINRLFIARHSKLVSPRDLALFKREFNLASSNNSLRAVLNFLCLQCYSNTLLASVKFHQFSIQHNITEYFKGHFIHYSFCLSASIKNSSLLKYFFVLIC